jgi:hypothetical protein
MATALDSYGSLMREFERVSVLDRLDMDAFRRWCLERDRTTDYANRLAELVELIFSSALAGRPVRPLLNYGWQAEAWITNRDLVGREALLPIDVLMRMVARIDNLQFIWKTLDHDDCSKLADSLRERYGRFADLTPNQIWLLAFDCDYLTDSLNKLHIQGRPCEGTPAEV